MGLFSNDKKPRPVCGETTPRLLAIKIANKTPQDESCSSSLILYLSNHFWESMKVDAGDITEKKPYIERAVEKHLDELRYLATSLREIME